MVKYLFFLLTAFASLAQVTKSPKLQRQSSQETRITQVELTEEGTEVSFSFKMKESQGRNQYQGPNMGIFIPRQIEVTNQISFEAKSYLYDRENRKKYKFLTAKNIPINPEYKPVEEGKTYQFKVIFEKLPKGVELVDLIEGKDDANSTVKHWNFFEIKITNPAEIQALALTGRLYDIDSKKAILGQIAVYTENYNDLIDSVNTNSKGDFKLILEPSIYATKATALGYEPKPMEISMMDVKDEKQIDIYLKPLKNEDAPTEKTISETKVGESLILKNILFETGKAELVESSFATLNTLVDAMKINPKLVISVQGHTDNVGDPKLNLELSIDRVTSVRNYLIKNGIEGKRVQLRGFGGSKPLNANGSDAERQINRRVEIVVMES